MPYAGDYYGDYYGDYAGDPGFFSSVGNLIKKAAGVATAVFSGPAAVAGAVGNILSGSPNPQPPPPPLPQLPGLGNPPVLYQGPAAVQGTNGSVLVGGGQAGVPLRPDIGNCGVGMRGLHANKSTYVTRGGGTSKWPQQILVHPKGTECVKSRRMNPANPKALRRAIRRGRGAVKLLRGAAGAMGYTVVTKAAQAKRPKARRR